MSFERSRESLGNQTDEVDRPMSPVHAPVTRQTSSHACIQKKLNASYARKSRPKDALQFYDNAMLALPETAKSAHPVEKTTRKGRVRYLKHNTPGSFMSPLEAAVWSIYHIVAPKHAPAKANAHYDSSGQFIGVSLQEIGNFRSTMDDSLSANDLLDKNLVRGLAVILALSYFLEEDDLHRGNMSKYGFRIDFDMSLWPILGQFKEGTMTDWMFRTLDPERFVITARDIDNFPDISDAKPFYWPTIPQPVITEGTRNVLSTFIPISRNAFPTAENNLFKKLKDDPDFKNAVFKTFVKILLIDTSQYQSQIEQHIPDEMRHPNPATHHIRIIDLMTQHLAGRKEQLRSVLVKMPSFQEFLWEHGSSVKREIMDEFREYNEDIRNHESEKRNRDSSRDAGIVFEDIVHLENINNNFATLFAEAKKCACESMNEDDSNNRINRIVK